MSSHLDRAQMLMDVHRPKEAAQAILDHLAGEPNSAQAHAMLARCFLELKRFKEARREAEEAIHLSPDYGWAHYIRSFVLRDLKRPKEARRAIQEALRLEPENADFLSQSASLWNLQDKHDDAIRDAEHGLRIDPVHVECACDKAFGLMCQGKLAEANRTLQQILADYPDQSRVHATYGWIAYNSYKYRLSREHFAEALRIDPRNKWAEEGLQTAHWDNFLWNFMAALDSVPPKSIWDGIVQLFFWCVLYGILWINTWEPTKSHPVPTTFDIIYFTVVRNGICAIGLVFLTGTSLAKIRRLLTRQDRAKLTSGARVSAILAWTIPCLATLIMTVSACQPHRIGYAAGCVLFWGAVPLSSLGRFRSAPARWALAALTVVYFSTGAACVLSFAPADSSLSRTLENVAVSHVVIAVCMPAVLWAASLFEPDDD